ncbi:MAG TPA: hypothetical protein VGZ29_02210 [Terriglobia bacterium]|nr:hypothetical protein [Terriglobia bacterium]
MKTVVFIILIAPVVSLLIKEFSQSRKIKAARERALAEREERQRRKQQAADAAL